VTEPDLMDRLFLDPVPTPFSILDQHTSVLMFYRPSASEGIA